MKGEILNYSIQHGSGLITSEHGIRYHFTGSEWKGNGYPVPGLIVDFEPSGSYALAIYHKPVVNKSKDKIIAGLLALFLGCFGIHKFYLGFTVPGLIFLLINTVGFPLSCFTLGMPIFATAIISLIEGIIYLTKSDQEFYQLYEIEKKEWF